MLEVLLGLNLILPHLNGKNLHLIICSCNCEFLLIISVVCVCAYVTLPLNILDGGSTGLVWSPALACRLLPIFCSATSRVWHWSLEASGHHLPSLIKANPLPLMVHARTCIYCFHLHHLATPSCIRIWE